MAAGDDLIALVDDVIDHFNRRSLDLPDGMFTRQTQLFVNGVAFEAMLGRSPADPLVLMLTRGAAGYRFAVKAVQHAVPDGQLQRGEWSESHEGGERVLRGQLWLAGQLRGSGGRAELLIDIAAHFDGTALRRAAATLSDDALARLRAARSLP